jgi:hypothetical protein
MWSNMPDNGVSQFNRFAALKSEPASRVQVPSRLARLRAAALADHTGAGGTIVSPGAAEGLGNTAAQRLDRRNLAGDWQARPPIDSGRGPKSMLVAHGWGCDHTTLAPQIELFRTSYRVIAIDLRGHGASPVTTHVSGKA